MIMCILCMIVNMFVLSQLKDLYMRHPNKHLTCEMDQRFTMTQLFKCDHALF